MRSIDALRSARLRLNGPHALTRRWTGTRFGCRSGRISTVVVMRPVRVCAARSRPAMPCRPLLQVGPAVSAAVRRYSSSTAGRPKLGKISGVMKAVISLICAPSIVSRRSPSPPSAGLIVELEVRERRLTVRPRRDCARVGAELDSVPGEPGDRLAAAPPARQGGIEKIASSTSSLGALRRPPTRRRRTRQRGALSRASPSARSVAADPVRQPRLDRLPRTLEGAVDGGDGRGEGSDTSAAEKPSTSRRTSTARWRGGRC